MFMLGDGVNGRVCEVAAGDSERIHKYKMTIFTILQKPSKNLVFLALEVEACRARSE